MFKTLIIVHTINNFKKLEALFDKSSDLLALNPEVMFELDRQCINYLTIENFYSHENFFQDVNPFNKNLEEVLEKIDFACKDYLKISFAYRGNSQYFFTMFDDLFYLEKLINAMQIKYEKFYLYSEFYPEKITWKAFDYIELISHPVKGTVSFPLERDMTRDLKIINEYLDIELILDEKANSVNIAYFKRIKFLFKKIVIKLREKINNKPLKNKSKNNKIFIIQDGYEVLALKKYLPEFNYMHPVPSLRKKLNEADLKKIDYGFVEKIIAAYTDKNFATLKKYVNLIMYSYHNEILARVDYYSEIVTQCLENKKPKVLFFSIGIRDVFDMIMAHVANKKNIPVVFFQHGGSLAFFDPLYQKYVELTPQVRKTLIINSVNELEKSKHIGSKVIAMGSVLRYEMLHEKSENTDKEILFIARPYTSSTYRELLNNSSCHDMYRSCCDVLEILNNMALSAEVKLHPIGEDNAYSFVKKIIETNSYANIEIILGCSVESIFKRYRLIILDYLGSSLVTYLLTSKIEIILYIKNFNLLKISDKSKEDLLKRCHIAKNTDELHYLLCQYLAGKLESKWNIDFINQYIYPVDNGNPGENIANYIKSIS